MTALAKRVRAENTDRLSGLSKREAMKRIGSDR